MKLHKKELIYLVLVVSMSLFMFTSCFKIKYKATIYHNYKDLVRTDFLYNNKVRGMFYYDHDYGEELYDTTSPKTRTFVIKDEETFNQIFYENSLEVNFNKELIILHIFLDTCGRKYYFTNISLNNRILDMNLQIENTHKQDATMPYQRCLIIKMKKIDFSEVNITLDKSGGKYAKK